MNDLLNPLFSVPIFIVIAEILATIYLSRRQIKQRLIWIIGTYLAFVAVAVAFGFLVRDEFGFSWIPLIVITEPWGIILEELFRSLSKYFGFTQTFYGMVLGTILNCAIFYIIDRVSYPKYSDRVSDLHAT